MGKFTLFIGSNRQYYFNLKASNNEIILQSEGYITKSSCNNGIESVRINSQYDSRFLRKQSISDSYYFILTAANNQTIGKSQMYLTKQGMENGITSVKSNAPKAELIDLT